MSPSEQASGHDRTDHTSHEDSWAADRISVGDVLSRLEPQAPRTPRDSQTRAESPKR